jgi:pimeloyl-ACP methyl ester carboxylesterase
VKRLSMGLALLTVLPRPLLAQDAGSGASPRTVSVNGVELHYVEQGQGRAVVFVHGGLEDYRAWQPKMRAFSERYRTIAYSRRYNYPNARIAPRPDYSASVDADDLAALIRTLNLAPAHVVGVSYGAYGALLLAHRHPELVRSLVLSEAPVLRWLPDLEGGRTLFADFMSKLWDPTVRAFREGDEAGVKAAIDGFGELGYSGTDQKMTFAGLPPEIRAVILANAAEWRALAQSKDTFPDLPRSAVRRIKAPTLLLSGQRSLALHAAIDREMEKLLPRHERVVIANATHEMWSEYPAECGAAALAFLARH